MTEQGSTFKIAYAREYRVTLTWREALRALRGKPVTVGSSRVSPLIGFGVGVGHVSVTAWGGGGEGYTAGGSGGKTYTCTEKEPE